MRLSPTKIGGAGNTKGKNYVVCFHHADPSTGDLWILMRGTNTAGVTLTFAADSGSVVEPEFTAQAHDDKGTLIELIEEIQTT